MSRPPDFLPIPFLRLRLPVAPPAPDEAACAMLWDKYAMLDNIRAHSRMVAGIAREMAFLAHTAGLKVDIPSVYAAGMLHDLAKTHCIKFPGNHAQLGAAWVCRETGHQPVAQGVLLHVRWPWQLDEHDDALVDSHFLGMAIQYADKRVRHDEQVNLKDRFVDLYKRYGTSPLAVERIAETEKQAVILEKLLSRRLGVDLHAYSFGSGRLVA